MSFRHTYVTEHLYKSEPLKGDLEKIRLALEKLGTCHWQGGDEWGYFHGVIKDLDSFQTKIEYEQILEDLEKIGVRIKIVFE